MVCSLEQSSTEVWRSVRTVTRVTRADIRPCVGSLSTLSLEKAQNADQFFYFHTTPGEKSKRMIRRSLLLDGQSLGAVLFTLPPGDDEWLCPYFEPATRTLRFRKRNGDDADHVLELQHLAQSAVYRPLLRMAHGEGLLEKVPGTS